ncbi:PqiC family protein [Asaia astilbis]|uniref:PqiC family protein n=1 Tax=Asaia astilbis TaxID=610244 RepID=UPI00055BBCC0|nr:PqiC family protein [Asaia astilbis]
MKKLSLSGSRRTMRRHAASLGLALVMATGLSACGSDPTLYSIAPVPGVAQSGGPVVVEVRTPVVAASLDRDEIVRQDKDYKLGMAKGNAWSEAIGDMIGRVLTQDLAQRLPGTTVFAQNDAVSTKPLAFVELTVTAFNADQKGNASLVGSLSIHGDKPGIGPNLTVPVQLQAPLDNVQASTLVAGLSTLTGQLADQAAQKIRALPVLPITP